MEDRKRSAGQSADDLAPPTKRQAVNGSSRASADADMPWKDDLEVSDTRHPDTYCLHEIYLQFVFPLSSQNLILSGVRLLLSTIYVAGANAQLAVDSEPSSDPPPPPPKVHNAAEGLEHVAKYLSSS